MATVNKTFKAKANVNVTIDLRKYKQVVEFNKRKLAEIREADPSVMELPQSFYTRVIGINQIIEIGDNFEYNEDTMQIVTYPVEMFERLSKQMIELAPETQGLLDAGELEKSLNQTTPRMSQESIKRTVEEQRALHGFNPTVLKPLLERVV